MLTASTKLGRHRVLFQRVARLSHLVELQASSSALPQGFRIVDNFLDFSEQKLLLSACLSKLDSMDPPPLRRKRKRIAEGRQVSQGDITSVFLSDDCYAFQEVFSMTSLPRHLLVTP
jgi:hypothetical protein